MIGSCFFLRGLEDVGGTLFFSHVGCAGGGPAGLWKTDGTVAGTVPVEAGFNVFQRFFTLTDVGNTLYFSNNDGSTGYELWSSKVPYNDQSTEIVADINPGPGSSDPLELTDFNGTLFFSALNSLGERELWQSTPASTDRVSSQTFSASGRLDQLTVAGSDLFFTANSSSDLWRSDGTDLGTEKIKDIQAANLTASDNKLFFTGTDGSGDAELWMSDGTPGGTHVVKQINTAGSSRPSFLADLDGKLIFGADDGSTGLELWKSNGTVTGTQPLKDINQEEGSSRPVSLTDVSGKLFLAADDGIDGQELWESDGTEVGTIPVEDLSPGPQDGGPVS